MVRILSISDNNNCQAAQLFFGWIISEFIQISVIYKISIHIGNTALLILANGKFIFILNPGLCIEDEANDQLKKKNYSQEAKTLWVNDVAT